MRTVVELTNSNCTWCRDTMIEHLTARPLVRQVHVNSTTACLVVDHNHDTPTALLEEIHDDLHGWELADNGEKVMVDLGVHERLHCPPFSGRDSREESHE